MSIINVNAVLPGVTADFGAKCNTAFSQANDGDTIVATGQHEIRIPIVMLGKAVDVDFRRVRLTCAATFPKDKAVILYGSDKGLHDRVFRGPWIDCFSPERDGFVFRNLTRSAISWDGVRAARCGVIQQSRGGWGFNSNVFSGNDGRRAVLSNCIYAVKCETDGGSCMNANTMRDLVVAMIAGEFTGYWQSNPAATVFLALDADTGGWVIRDSTIEAEKPCRLLYATNKNNSLWQFTNCWREGVTNVEGGRGIHVALIGERNPHETFWTNGVSWSVRD
jgi:hypothetical protein